MRRILYSFTCNIQSIIAQLLHKIDNETCYIFKALCVYVYDEMDEVSQAIVCLLCNKISQLVYQSLQHCLSIAMFTGALINSGQVCIIYNNIH